MMLFMLNADMTMIGRKYEINMKVLKAKQGALHNVSTASPVSDAGTLQRQKVEKINGHNSYASVTHWLF